jgi:hypothetical protein
LRANGPPIVNHNQAAIVYKGSANPQDSWETGEWQQAGGE